MMKFLLILIFMVVMVVYVSLSMFFYNLCFFVSFMLIFLMMSSGDNFCSISIYFGVDYYSVMMIILTSWIIGAMFMCMYDGKLKHVILILVLAVLSCGFSSLNLMLFYLFFEISLVPMFIIVINWGLNMERLEASYYMLMYTLFISLPLLFYILDLGKNFSSLDLSMLIEFSLIEVSLFSYMIYLMSFLIKMPMYFFHVWLPKAHVEAPVYGSMILAAVLLKLGGYGLSRILMIFLLGGLKYGYIIFSIGLVGAMLMSLLTLVQIDMKMLVAYSSVVHMNIVICSMMTFFKIGFIGCYLIMVSHGLCSSGLFYMVTLMYNRSNSRLLMMNKGMISFMSSMMIFWAYLCVSNFSFPLSLNFLGEIMVVISVVMWEIKIMVLMMMIGFFSSAYTLYLFSYVMHGVGSGGLKFNGGEVAEYVVLIIHCYPIMMLMLKLNV